MVTFSSAQSRFPLRALGRPPLLLGVLLAAPLSLLAPSGALAQQSGYGQTLGGTTMEQQVYDSGGGPRSGSGSLLNSTNPMDLMNRIRKGTAMDDATPPASAIDQALKELNAQPAPSVSSNPHGIHSPSGSPGPSTPKSPSAPRP